ncbi:MAG TPA: hypothetical protein VM074_05760 [Solimonas sp.]|nr:hypothetical protein [Solimonas sp.]
MKLRTLSCVALLAAASGADAYPVDGYPYTGIRRLDYAQRIQLGEIKGRMLQPGQYLPMAQVLPRWHKTDGTTLPPLDPELSQRVSMLLPAGAREKYSVALLDLSNPDAPLLAIHNPQIQANVGSVGKLVVALAIFQALADIYPNDTAARERVLHDTRVIADEYSQYDHHHVPFWNPQTLVRASRSIRVGDEASLWEFMDWMLSASSNSAGSMVQKELIAIRHFGKAYPPPRAEYDAFFHDSTNHQRGEIYKDIERSAVTRAGLDPEKIRQGTLFTRGGKRKVEGASSFATTEQLVRILYRIEAGTFVDEFSSREAKRLLYMTQRRIRYASHPVLNPTAVYFKSGSFYQCSGLVPCGKYKGDKTNRLASVAIVEAPAETPKYRYLVAVMSNVLRVNSAVAHQTLALRMHRLVESLHPELVAPPPVPESAFPTVPVDDPDDKSPPASDPQ